LFKTAQQGITLVPLGQLLASVQSIGQGRIGKGKVPGRQGWVACQQKL
jgi:undecaprenyl phosphate-alpha-L-ara4FN deformylase